MAVQLHHQCRLGGGRQELLAPAVEELEDLRGRAGLAQSREDARDAVVVSVCVHVRHRIHSQRDVEPVLVRMPCGRLDANARGDSGDHHLRDA